MPDVRSFAFNEIRARGCDIQWTPLSHVHKTAASRADARFSVIQAPIPARAAVYNRPDMQPLEGKVAIITGAGRLRGIGRATAVALAADGADVVVTGTSRDPSTFPDDEKAAGWRGIESTAAQVREQGRRCLALQA